MNAWKTQHERERERERERKKGGGERESIKRGPGDGMPTERDHPNVYVHAQGHRPVMRGRDQDPAGANKWVVHEVTPLDLSRQQQCEPWNASGALEALPFIRHSP